MESKSMQTLIVMLETMRRFTGNNEIQMQQLLTFAHVAERQEMPMADLVELTGVAQSSVSRNVAKLGRGENPLKRGLELMEAFEDPFYRKRKLVKLTPRGQELLREVNKAAQRYIK